MPRHHPSLWPPQGLKKKKKNNKKRSPAVAHQALVEEGRAEVAVGDGKVGADGDGGAVAAQSLVKVALTALRDARKSTTEGGQK